jgi:type II secretory pathway pseudopilin PulG
MNIKQKRGIAMIELIFALVIIGIVLMSAPMLIFQASQSNTVAIQQEAISAISAHTNILMSKHWDEADANLSAGVAPILTTSFTNNFLDINSTTKTRGGLYPQSSRLTLYNSAPLSASPIGSDGDDRDDIDDYHNTDNNVSVYANQSTNSQKGDYVDVNLNIHTDVRYVKDNPTIFDVNSTVNAIEYNNTTAPNTSNIKFIHVVLTSNSGIKELNKTITLEAFSCNIGTTTINGKKYE